MAKKVVKTFNATLIRNLAKGGGWLAIVTVKVGDEIEFQIMNPWTNASASKRWIKEQVRSLTPRKNIKMIAVGPTIAENNKPHSFVGVLTFKSE
jgi:hypothetical protein